MVMVIRSANTTGNASPTSSPHEPDRLNIGAIIGIVIGAVACTSLLGIIVFCLYRRRTASRFSQDSECFEADPDHEIPRPRAEADPDHEIPRHRTESINIAGPSSHPQFGLSISPPSIAGASSISGSTLRPSPPSIFHGNSKHKRLSADQILGIDKESFLKELPQLEANLSVYPRRIHPATHLTIDPYDAEYDPNPYIFGRHLVNRDSTNHAFSSTGPLNFSAEAHTRRGDESNLRETFDSTPVLPARNDDLYQYPPPQDKAPTVSVMNGSHCISCLARLQPGHEAGDLMQAHDSTSIDMGGEPMIWTNGDVATSPTQLAQNHIAHGVTTNLKGKGKAMHARHLSMPIDNNTPLSVFTLDLEPVQETEDVQDTHGSSTSPSGRTTLTPTDTGTIGTSTKSGSDSTKLTPTSSRTTPSMPTLSPTSTVCTIAPDFPCVICGISFSTVGQRNVHNNRKHVRRYICPVCNKGFHLQADLKRHQGSVHRTGAAVAGKNTHWLTCPNAGCKTSEKKWDPNRKDNFVRHVARCKRMIAKAQLKRGRNNDQDNLRRGSNSGHHTEPEAPG